MSPIEMFVEGEAPAPEPHPRGGRRRLGPGRRCRGKKHLTLAFWAAPPPGPGSRCAGGPGERRQLGAGRRLPPPACCTLGSQPARQAARRARGRQPAASRERRALPTPCPPPPPLRAEGGGGHGRRLRAPGTGSSEAAGAIGGLPRGAACASGAGLGAAPAWQRRVCVVSAARLPPVLRWLGAQASGSENRTVTCAAFDRPRSNPGQA